VSRTLYIDAIGGVAGDMLLGALLDAGASLDGVRAGLGSLGVEVALREVERHGIGATRLEVRGAEDEPPHRDWAAVRALIEEAGLHPRAAARAQRAFAALARAEGRVHRVDPQRVRFHEVGAVDALADVCGTMLALEDLDVERVVCSPLPLGRGVIDAAHGRLPLPAPAVLELLGEAPVHGIEEEGETVTPTGAALVATLADAYGLLPPLRASAVGYGAGARQSVSRPNLLRVVLGEGDPVAHSAFLVACTLDDLPGELIADAAEACAAAGALDVWVAPVTMKKGRPGVVFSALARPERRAAVAEAMLRHTSTLGVRVAPVGRYELERETLAVDVDGQRVAVKLGRLADEVVNVAPEHDDVARAARALGQPAKRIWAQALAEAGKGWANDA
jgi:uncharacterized protein (TIGR00299 family) protein